MMTMPRNACVSTAHCATDLQCYHGDPNKIKESRGLETEIGAPPSLASGAYFTFDAPITDIGDLETISKKPAEFRMSEQSANFIQ
jgi:hypothetical protein